VTMIICLRDGARPSLKASIKAVCHGCKSVKSSDVVLSRASSLKKALELIARFLGFVLWKELGDEIGSELCPCWGCSCRVWVEGSSELIIYLPAQTPPGPPCMKDKVHAIRAVSSLNWSFLQVM